MHLLPTEINDHEDSAPARIVLFLICCLWIFFASETAAADLTAAENRIVAAIEANHAAAMGLLKRSVDINSGSLNLDGVAAVGRVFQEQLDSLGFETRWIDGSDWQRAGHLVATVGDSGPHFLLIGHLDTVFAKDSPFQRFSETEDPDWVSGPGVSDMKGGNVVIVEAVRALAKANALTGMTVTVVLIGDEESSGKPFSLSRKDLQDAARAADIALAFESGDDDPQTAVIARRGYTGWRLQVEGTPAHSSQVFKPAIGVGAIYEMARILNSFREEMAQEEYLTFNPGVVLGGTDLNYHKANTRGDAFGKPNVVAKTAVVTGDLRTISLPQLENAKKKMQGIVADSLPGTRASIIFEDGFPPFAPTQGNRDLLKLYDQVSRDLGFGEVTAVDPGSAGAADISFTAGLVKMGLDGLGMLGAGSHTEDETADVRSLSMQTQRAAIMMYRLAQDWPR